MAETVTEEVVETTTTTEPQTSTTGKTLDEMAAEVARMEKALKEANKEAASRRKKLDDFEKAEQARKDAELSEVERLKKEAETYKAQAAEAQRSVLQRDIAAEVGLPPVLASRLQGADREAMIEDAKAMLEALPKPTTPTGRATNPGAATQGETDEQRRQRLGLR
jgi:septal ring factor EnvC (AmiA/AmiB activator)